MSWSISVKTVGGGSNPISTDDSDQAVSKPKPTDFTVDVEPEDPVTSLYTQIENITGLSKGQQRLIYRGRLLDKEPSGRIKDVDGLGDGQTIHLVPKRPDPAQTRSESESTSTSTIESTLLQSASEEGSDTMVGSASAGILAALLGLGSSSSSNLNAGDDNDDDADVDAIFPLPRPRSRISSRRRTANVYRRFATDPRYPEPGPIEPVRQSLMTLHTMVGSRPQNLDEKEQQRKGETNAKRKWYKGQWLDCRDTVNQWLEATVVEIIAPNEILKTANVTPNDTPKGDNLSPSTDPAIGAEDMDGRRKLLLESTDDAFDKTLSELNNDDKLIGYRERFNNEHIQLMLVHYNGWPRRWDEWIRSDSERIRPFRTRSKHVSSHSHVCPSPNSTFVNAPETHITHEDDEIDRVALLPELHRSLNSIQDLFGESLQQEKDPLRVKTLTLEEQLDLARAVNKLQGDRLEKIRNMFDDSTSGAAKCADESDIDLTHLNDRSKQKINRLLQEARVRVRSDNRRVEPDSQLPWAACEGDSKPKADGDEVENTHQADNDNESRNDLQLFDKHKLEALAPLLDRLGRVLIDAAPHVAAIAESLPDKKSDIESTVESCVVQPEEETAPRDSLCEQSNAENPNRLFSIQEENLPVSTVTDDTDAMPPLLMRENSGLSDDSTEGNPDYVDFVNGFVHATRGDSSARSGGIRRGGPSEGSLGSSLFSALLASGNSGGGDDDDDEDSRNSGGRSGPRVLRVGGGGGGGSGGIDIHIHAIVTGGGGGIAGVGLDALGGLGGLLSPPPSAVVLNNPSGSAGSRADSPAESALPIIPTPEDEDDLGLFSDLYSDDPRPEGTRSFTSSATWSDDIEIPDDDEEDDESDSPPVTTINDDSSSDSMIRILPIPISGLTRDSSADTSASAPPNLSNTQSSISSSNRLQNESRGLNDRTVNQQPRSTSHEPRRSNSIRGLFRRVLTRRSSNNT